MEPYIFLSIDRCVFLFSKEKKVSWYLCLKILSLKDILILILIFLHLAYERREKTQSEALLFLRFSCLSRTTYGDYDMVTQPRQSVHCNIKTRHSPFYICFELCQHRMADRKEVCKIRNTKRRHNFAKWIFI